MGLLSRESVEVPRSSGVAEGVEFEETFPDDGAPLLSEAAVVATPPRLTVIRTERAAAADGDLVERIEAMLVDWQSRFEARLEQRRIHDERLAERRRRSEDERLRAWRTELEQQLLQRFSERRPSATPTREHALSPVHQSIAGAASARDVGRIMRDVLTELATTCSFALSLHHRERNEVAYRYRVASEDELGAFLRRETLDDGPDSAVARMDGWVRAHRPVRIGTRNVVVYTAQCPVRLDDATIGVLTLQTEAESLADSVLATVAELLAAAAPRLAELRETSAFRGA